MRDFIEKNKYIKLYSFDIFDTLITRTTFNPIGIFLLMQNELIFNEEYSDIPSFVRRNFKTLRMGAENFLKRTRCLTRMDRILSPEEAQQEFSLKDFYALMGERHNLSDEQQKKLINLEIETEINNSLPITENIEILKELILEGKRVILVSDMYLEEDTIRRILTKHDDIFKDIKIYVSSKYQEFKGTGKLYHAVAKEEGIDNYSKWLHIGDNLNSDIKQAEKLKIKTYHFKKEERTEFESIFYNNTLLELSPEAQVLLGSSTYTRNTLKDNPMADFATLATIVLYPYVKWLINKSLDMGLTRLYFIARDGYVLKEIADVIIEQEKIENLKTYYIYGSRDAWRLPCAKNSEDIIFILTYYINNTTISFIAERYGITTGELKKFLHGKFKKENKILTADNLTTKRNMLDTPEFIEFILNKNKEKKELLIEYLRQNVDFSDDKFAFVDLTCSGTTNCLLADLIKDNFNVLSKCFTIILYRNLENNNITFYDYTQQFYESIIVEIFGRAPHGQTVGYENKEGKIIPILSETEKFENFNEYVDAIKHQVKILNYASKINNELNFYNFSAIFANSIKNNYTSDIAKYFSSVEYSSVGTNEEFSINKEKFNVVDILNIFYFRKMRPMQKQIDFVLENSNILVQGLARFFRKHSKLNAPQIKHSLKHTLIEIKSRI